MADDNIHDLFSRSDGSGLGTIDTAAVIRRSRARRRPAQLAAGGALVLALGAFGVFGVQALVNTPRDATTAGEAVTLDSELQYSAEDSETRDLDAENPRAELLNLCGAPVAVVAPSPSGLELTVDFPDAAVGSPMVEGTVTLTNTGPERVAGTTAALPQVTLSQNGTVAWHSNGAMIDLAVGINLAPGESFDYAASFTPVVCSTADDWADGFGTDLPAAPAGDYQVSAAIDLLGPNSVELVTGPPSTITLR